MVEDLWCFYFFRKISDYNNKIMDWQHNHSNVRVIIVHAISILFAIEILDE